MKKEVIVTFETAKLAKAKGFSNGTKKVFIEWNDGSNLEEYSDYLTINNKKGADLSNKQWTVYERPTQGVLKEWLRTYHNIDVTTSVWGEKDLYVTDSPIIKHYHSRIDKWDKIWSVHDGTGAVMPEHYHTEDRDDFYDAFNDGLKRGLELI